MLRSDHLSSGKGGKRGVRSFKQGTYQESKSLRLVMTALSHLHKDQCQDPNEDVRTEAKKAGPSSSHASLQDLTETFEKERMARTDQSDTSQATLENLTRGVWSYM